MYFYSYKILSLLRLPVSPRGQMQMSKGSSLKPRGFQEEKSV